MFRSITVSSLYTRQAVPLLGYPGKVLPSRLRWKWHRVIESSPRLAIAQSLVQTVSNRPWLRLRLQQLQLLCYSQGVHAVCPRRLMLAWGSLAGCLTDSLSVGRVQKLLMGSVKSDCPIPQHLCLFIGNRTSGVLIIRT